MTEGHQNFRQVLKKPKPGDWLTVKPDGFSTLTDRSDVLMGKVIAIHGVRSSTNPLPDTPLKLLMHKRLKLRADPSLASNLTDHFKLRQSCWLIEETEEGEFNCDCPVGFKGKNCKHALGLSYKKDRIPVLPHAEALKLGDRRKRGRPKAINMARPFSASVVVADEVAGVEEVTVEVAGQQDFAVEVVGLQQEVVLEAAGLEELAMEAPSLEELALDGFVWEEPTREKPAEDEDAVEEEVLVEADKDVVAKGRAGKTVKRAKVVSPALKSGVRNAVTKKVTKSRSPKTRAANKKRVHESAPPSANTSPVLKPPAKKKGTTTRRRAGVVENLID